MRLAKLLEGKVLAEKIKLQLAEEIKSLKTISARSIVLAGIAIGSDEASKIYTNFQKKTASALGIEYQEHNLDKDISEDKLIDYIAKLNQDPFINGIILHQPLPAHINDKKINEFIDVLKDVEGVHPKNLGRLFFGQSKISPCTAAAVMELIKSSGVDLHGKNAVIVGRSEIVGKPLIFLLLDYSPTVTVCHSGTSKAGKLQAYVEGADILIAAVGKANFIKGKWIKEGSVVIDVGINKVGDKIVGDVEFSEASKRAGFISPVPGGVGPLTVVMLMRNLIENVKLQNQVKS